MLLALTLVCGVGYPLVVLGIGQVVAHGSANGSLVEHEGSVVGSSSLGQQVTDPQWFQGRRSASEYAGNTSGGSNLGPNDPKQSQAVSEARDALVAANPQAPGPPPPDALTASASGLDPDISPAYASWQVPRVAAARGLPTTQIQDSGRRTHQGPAARVPRSAAGQRHRAQPRPRRRGGLTTARRPDR